MMKSILIIALLVAVAYCAADWNKILNNVVSIGIKNALAEGTLRTLYPLDFNQTQSRECCNKCNRKFVLPESFYTDENASNLLGGALAQVYNTNQLLVGVSEATGNSSTLFTQYPNGTFGGILVDATQAIADQISFILAVPVVANFTVVPLNESFFESVVSSLGNNTIQVFADVSYTFARARQVDFTCFYSSPEKIAFYVNPNNLPTGADNTSSLTASSFNAEGITVAVTSGTIYEQAARELLPNANITTYPDLNAVYNALGNDAQVAILPALNITVFNETNGSNNTNDSDNNTSGVNGTNVVQLNDLIFEYGTGVGFATYKAAAAESGATAPTTAAPTTAAPTDTTAAPTTAAPTTAAPTDTTAAPTDTTTAAPTDAITAEPVIPTEAPSTTTAAPVVRSLAGRRHKKH